MFSLKASLCVSMLAVSVALLACAPRIDLNTVPEANLGTPYAVTSKTGLATIKGSGDTSGDFIKASKVAYLISIDGQLTTNKSISDPVEIEPGLHALVVGYHTYGASGRGFAPLVLDAKPGASYVIKEEHQGGLIRLTLDESRTDQFLYVEDEKTGQIVTDKVTDALHRNTKMFVPSTASDAATLHGAKMAKLIGSNACFIASVDGGFMPTVEGPTFLDPDRSDFDAVAKIAPGLHALALGLDFGNIRGVYAFLLDAQPSATYRVKCDIVDRKLGGRRNASINLSVVNETANGAVILDRDLPIDF